MSGSCSRSRSLPTMPACATPHRQTASTSAPRAARQRSRVATRYPRVTRRHFAASGRQVEPLTLSAPGLLVALGFADGVIELEHLLPQGEDALVVREQVAVCSARLVAGRQARALQGAGLAKLIDRLREGGGDT